MPLDFSGQLVRNAPRRPCWITVAPQRIEAMITGARYAQQPGMATADEVENNAAKPTPGAPVTLTYEDGTSETADLGPEFVLHGELSWLEIVRAVQDKRK